jgi:3-dehydroquinate dehydratase-2
MKNILILNGPNLQLLGQRNPDIYGSMTYQTLVDTLIQKASTLNVSVSFYQSNHEGDLIDQLHQAQKNGFDRILFNPGALTHYAYALHDAIEAITVPVIEVHLSNIYTREEAWRKISVIEPVVSDRFYGEGIQSYLKALEKGSE